MTRKAFLPLFVLAILCSFSASAQLRWKYGKKNNTPTKNKIYAEVLGSGFQWSLNYERKFGVILVRVGGSYSTGDFFMPTVISYSSKKIGPMNFEAGLGLLNKFVVEDRDYALTEVRPDYEFFPTLNFAATYKPRPRGFFVKVALTPIFDFSKNESLFFGQEKPMIPMFFWGGASLGVSF